MAEFLTEPIYSHSGFLRLICLSFQSNHYYVKPRVTDHQFGIRHYAGEVGVHSVFVRCLVYLELEILDFRFRKSRISLSCIFLQSVFPEPEQRKLWSFSSTIFFSSVVWVSRVTYGLGDKLLLTCVIHLVFSRTFVNKQNTDWRSQGKFCFWGGGEKAKYLLQKGKCLQAFKVKCCSLLWRDTWRRWSCVKGGHLHWRRANLLAPYLLSTSGWEVRALGGTVSTSWSEGLRICRGFPHMPPTGTALHLFHLAPGFEGVFVQGLVWFFFFLIDS